MPRYLEKIESITLPVIPLRGTVAFPSLPVNIELQRDISKNAVEAADKNNAMVFVAAQKDMSIESPSKDDLYSVGTVIRLKQSIKGNNGSVRIIAEGVCRATVSSVYMKNDCIYADIITKQISLEKPESDLKTEALSKEAISLLRNFTAYMPSISDDIIYSAEIIKSPGLLADFIAMNVFVRFNDKQEILEIYDPLKRLEKISVILENELKLLKMELAIHKKVKEQIDENQKEYYLREQLKVIQNELGGGVEDEISEYYSKIESASLPNEVEEKLKKEVFRLQKSSFGSPEASVIRNYLDICLEIPWNKKTKDRIDIEKSKKILNNDHYGLSEVKDRIIEYLAVKKLSPDLKNQIILLVGPPGVGKTSLGRSIARAMNRKFARISLGGVKDESDIRGHRKTYVASMPGRIISALIDAKVQNPVILIDEIDKMCSNVQGDPASAMLEVLDGEQNKAFRDHFVEIPVDLSDCIFIATANSLSSISRPLLDRMEIIQLHTYTKNEKMNILKEHLLPKQLKRHGLSKRTLKIDDEVLEFIIDGYTRESGVRNLERYIAALSRKAVRIIIEENKKSVTVSCDNIETILGPRKFIQDKTDAVDSVGIVNGLAYTEVGGDVLKIESVVMDGSGKIELTGNLGDVMKESAHIAYSYIRANSNLLGIDGDFYKTKDIHIHVPEGAVPKDGPSAGVSMLTSMVSALVGRKISHNVAMTGEFTLAGRVLPIGGLREKTTAAWSAGISNVLIPYDNLQDLEEIDQEIRRLLNFIPCKNAYDVLDNALLPFDDEYTHKLKNPSDKVSANSEHDDKAHNIISHIPSQNNIRPTASTK